MNTNQDKDQKPQGSFGEIRSQEVHNPSRASKKFGVALPNPQEYDYAAQLRYSIWCDTTCTANWKDIELVQQIALSDV